MTDWEHAFITRHRVARLGTVHAHGQPAVVPIVYAFDGTALFTPLDAKPKRVVTAQRQRVRNKGGSDGNADDVVTSTDCFVLGSRTYEHALQLGWPYGDTPTIVTTNRELSSTRKSVEFYSGDLKKLVDEILASRYGNIWLVGGAMLCQSFLRLGLVDEIRLSIIPILLGDGLRLFDNSGIERRWHLKNVVATRPALLSCIGANQPTPSPEKGRSSDVREHHVEERWHHRGIRSWRVGGDGGA